MTPFLVYLAADRLGASGVLAAATAGMMLGQKGGGMYTPEARIVGRSVWNTLFFVFNGALFIILGLQLRSIFTRAGDLPGAATLAQYALAIAATVIAVRFAVGRSASRVRWKLRPPRDGTRGRAAAAARLFVRAGVGRHARHRFARRRALDSGIRLPAGAPFPARDLILFITFAVILVTLLGQGSRCRGSSGAFSVVDDEREPISPARWRACALSEAALARLVELEPTFETTTQWEVAGRLRAKYEDQASHFRAAHRRLDERTATITTHELERQLVREAIDAERAALNDMRHAGEISDETFRRMQYDIDLAESRLLTP